MEDYFRNRSIPWIGDGAFRSAVGVEVFGMGVVVVEERFIIDGAIAGSSLMVTEYVLSNC